MTEIFLLGTFHFRESKMNFFTNETQDELKQLIKRISRFFPDAVAVELASSQQSAIDKSYAELNLSDFDDFEKMKTDTLGNITMFGQERPIRYSDESVQVGYRLGKELGLQRVYGIDEDIEMDGTMFMNPSPRVMSAIQKMQDFDKGHEDSVIDQYRFLNTDEWSKRNHHIYMAVNAENSDGNFNGSMAILTWYERNLKIFSNIQRIAESAKRIFVLYGAGHLQLLRDFINETDGMKLTDIYEFI